MHHSFDVYIVYGDPLIMRLLDRHFWHAGCRTILCSESAKADEVLSISNSGGLLILDWQMPGLDCIDFCKRMKADYSRGSQHIIMVSEPLRESQILEAFNAGVDDLIFKPMSRSILIGRMIAAERLIKKALELRAERNFWETYAQDLERISEQRGKQLADNERMVTLGILSAGIAHEINNPTSFISGNVQILERTMPILKQALSVYSQAECEDQDKARFLESRLPSIIEGMRAGVSRVTKIVNNLRTFVHNGSDSGEEISIKSLIEFALSMTSGQRSGQTKVNYDVPEDLPSIFGNLVRLEQVLVNLIVNAYHAVENQETREILVSSRCEADSVLISVADSGPGIPTDKMDRIWAPFYTTKAIGRGTGLGLHICKSIITEHNGTIQASNRKEGGAEFVISLPCSKKRVEVTK